MSYAAQKITFKEIAMKFSMYSGFMDILNRDGIEKAAKYAKDSGFSGVEFLYYAKKPELIPSVETAKEFKACLDSCGLSVPCVSVGATLVNADEPDRVSEPAVQGLIKAMDFSAAVGAKCFHHTLMHDRVAPPNLSYDGVLPIVLEGAKRIADYAKELGMTVIYEPQGPFFTSRANLGKFFREIKKLCSNVGICGDIANTYYCGEEPYALFEEFTEDIAHVHLNDYVFFGDVVDKTESGIYKQPDCKQVVIGEGDIDIKRVLTILKKVNYNGFMSVENRLSLEPKEVFAAVMDKITAMYE